MAAATSDILRSPVLRWPWAPLDPDDIPSNYLIAWYANHALRRNKLIIDETPAQPTGLTNVSWPFRKLLGSAAALFDIAVDRPLIGIVWLFEKTVRGDFTPAVQLAEQNVRDLKAQNDVYERELQKLAPINEIMLEIIALAEKTTDTATSQITMTEMIQTQKAIDLEAAQKAMRHVSAYIEEVLNQPKLLLSLQSYDERLTKIQGRHAAVTARLAKAQETHSRKLSRLGELMQEYETLGGLLSVSLGTYKTKATQRVAAFKPKQESGGTLSATIVH